MIFLSLENAYSLKQLEFVLCWYRFLCALGCHHHCANSSSEACFLPPWPLPWETWLTNVCKKEDHASCHGIPGHMDIISKLLFFPPSPIDFLVSPRNRLTYSILFGVMGTAVINGYGNFGSALSLETSNIYSQLFNKICEYCTAGADLRREGGGRHLVVHCHSSVCVQCRMAWGHAPRRWYRIGITYAVPTPFPSLLVWNLVRLNALSVAQCICDKSCVVPGSIPCSSFQQCLLAHVCAPSLPLPPPSMQSTLHSLVYSPSVPSFFPCPFYTLLLCGLHSVHAVLVPFFRVVSILYRVHTVLLVSLFRVVSILYHVYAGCLCYIL